MEVAASNVIECKLTIRNYITDGLVSMVDIENCGGLDIYTPGKIVDLVDGSRVAENIFIGSGVQFNGNHLTQQTPNMFFAFSENGYAETEFKYFKTIELVIKNPVNTSATAPAIWSEFSYLATKYGSANNWNPHSYVSMYGSKLFLGHQSEYTIPVIKDAVATYSFTQDEKNNIFVTTGAFYNGVAVSKIVSVNQSALPQVGCGVIRTWSGEFYTCRLYDRVLSAKEIAHNAKVDESRFRT